MLHDAVARHRAERGAFDEERARSQTQLQALTAEVTRKHLLARGLHEYHRRRRVRR